MLTLSYYSTKIPVAILRHIGVLVTMAIFIIFCLEISSAYLEKTKWYNIKETLPNIVWTFISSSVKKSTKLPKRLLRLSEIFLFEYKDWNGFLRKAKLLVLDNIAQSIGYPNLFDEIGK